MRLVWRKKGDLNTNNLTLQQTALPATIEDLSKFVLLGREKLTAVRAEIRAIDRLQLAEEVRNQKRDEAQMLSEALLDAEVRLGDLLKLIPKSVGGRPRIENTTDSGVDSFKIDSSVDFEKSTCKWNIDRGVVNPKPKKEVIAELGFSQKQAERFETLADNKDLVEQVKAEARENDDLASRSRVLDLAAARKKQEIDYYAKLDLGLDVYKELGKIVVLVNDFQITPERMSALLENYDDVITVDGQIQDVRNAISILQQIIIFLERGRKNAKR